MVMNSLLYQEVFMAAVCQHVCYKCPSKVKYCTLQKHFKEMNSYVGMMISLKKEQGQDDYFNQQSILLTLPTDVGWLCEKYVLLIEIIILSLFFLNQLSFLHSCSFP